MNAVVKQMPAQIQSRVQTITPELASAWLKLMPKNRPARQRHVRNLAAAIERGEWLLTGESVKFDEVGNLIDGQHRLLAVIEAGKPITTLVVHGVSTDTFSAIDCGAKRSPADALALLGWTQPLTFSGALKQLWTYHRGTFNGHGGANQNDSATTTELVHLAATEEGARLHAAVLDVMQGAYCEARSFLRPSVAAFLLMKFRERDAEAANAFFASLCSGVDLRADSPVLVLRERLRVGRDSKHKMSYEEQAALTVKAWRYWVNGVAIRGGQSLRYKMAGPRAEQFPSID